MAIYRFEDRTPVIGNDTFVSPSAAVVGKVKIGRECYIAPGAVVKGDYGEIRIGDGTSVQDNVVIHARPGEVTDIGDDVTLGHGCIVHNAIVRDHAVIGMGAIISDYAEIGEWAVVAEGAVVKQESVIPAGKIAVGVPARVIGDVKEHHREELSQYKDIYRDLARRYGPGLVRID